MRKQISIDGGAWKLLIQGKKLAQADGIDYPSHSDAIRAMAKRCNICETQETISGNHKSRGDTGRQHHRRHH